MTDSLSPPAALQAATAQESIPTSRPAVAPPDAFVASRVRVADGLTQSLILPALDAGGDAASSRDARANGWTPDRIRDFLNALADCGVVEDAARAAGMTRKSAYALRNRAGAEAFQLAWRAALVVARGRLADEVMSRALNGCVELIYRNGVVVGERHRYDNRLTMAVLARLDAQASDSERRMVNQVAREFEDFADIVADGGEEAAAFFEARGNPYTLDSDLLALLKDPVMDASADAADPKEAEEDGAA